MPSMITEDFVAPVYQGFFNELKQQFISARYLFYASRELLPEHKRHYSDDGRTLVDTMDYALYGLRIEHLKNSFKTCYSIFDKVAYFLNSYLKLGIDESRVSFRRLWYDDKKTVRKDIEALANLPLRGLYFLSKDIHDPDPEYVSTTDPQAQQVAEIRNHMEHRYFKVHLFYHPKPSESDELCYDSLSYSVSEQDLETKTLRLIRTAREALIYLSAAVHIEERKRSRPADITMNFELYDYDE